MYFLLFIQLILKYYSANYKKKVICFIFYLYSAIKLKSHFFTISTMMSVNNLCENKIFEDFSRNILL